MNYPPVLSYGGGVNSTALAILLVNEGWHGHIVFADTGTEWPDTYCFIDYFEREWLKPRGLEITRLGAEWRPKSRKASIIERCERDSVIPIPMAGRWCTSEYKTKPQIKWCKARGLSFDTDSMCGIAADESHRMLSACRPLVDHNIDRNGCMRIIQEAGLNVPRKSGCYICPFQRDNQWHELWQRYPELYARAEALENFTRRQPGRTTNLVLAVGGKTTLAMRRLRYESQLPLLDPADMDELLEYRPCQCHL